jgi:hypothetical protein
VVFCILGGVALPITLRGVADISKLGFANKLKENLIEFFRWGLAQAGNYQDVDVITPGTNTGTPDCLYPVSIPGQSDQTTATIWQANNPQWAYETGLIAGREPIVISSIYVNGTSSPNNESTYYIDYPNGRIVFSTAIPATSVVQTSYSYRYYNIYDQTEPWFSTIIYNQFGADQSNSPDGALALLKTNRVQLPVILIEDVPDYKFVPKEIGDISQHAYQDFLMHIIAETAQDRTDLVSIITAQKESVIMGFEPNLRAAANDFLIDYKGRLQSGSNYEGLVSAYPWQQIQFADIKNSRVDSRLPFYRAICRVTLEAWYQPQYP